MLNYSSFSLQSGDRSGQFFTRRAYWSLILAAMHPFSAQRPWPYGRAGFPVWSFATITVELQSFHLRRNLSSMGQDARVAAATLSHAIASLSEDHRSAFQLGLLRAPVIGVACLRPTPLTNRSGGFSYVTNFAEIIPPRPLCEMKLEIN